MAETKTIKVKLVRSPIGRPGKHKRIIESLGLRKLNSVNELPDNGATRGAIFKVNHLVQVIE